MSFGVRCDDCGLEYAGARGVRGMLATPSSLTKPSYLRMLTEVRGSTSSPPRAARSRRRPHVARRLPRRGRILRLLAHHFVLPLTGAIWSSHPPDARVPGPLPVPLPREPRHADVAHARAGGPWSAAAALRGGHRPRLHAVRAGDPGARGRRRDGRRRCPRRADGGERGSTRVVIATHPDQALACWPTRRGDELRLLARSATRQRDGAAHRRLDPPPRRRARAPPGTICSTHAPRRATGARDLPHEPPSGPRRAERLLRHAQPHDRIAPEPELRRFVYEHPVYTADALDAQRLLPGLPDGATRRSAAPTTAGGSTRTAASPGIRAALALGVALVTGPALYEGQVMHTRPSGSALRCSAIACYMWLVDLDRPAAHAAPAAPLRRDPLPRPPGRPGAQHPRERGCLPGRTRHRPGRRADR